MLSDHWNRLEEVYHNAPVNKLFKPQLVIAERSATSTMYADPAHFHAGGGLHGAFYFKMLDDTAYFAAQSIETEYFLLTGTFEVKFLRPVIEGSLKCEGLLLEQEGKKFRAKAELFQHDKLVATGQGVFIRSGKLLKEISNYDRAAH